MKKWIGVNVFTALLIWMMLFAQAAPAVSSGQDTGIDIVMVIDRSGSMNNTDRTNMALAATRTLAKISSTGQEGSKSGVNMALVAFGYDIVGQSYTFHNVSDPVELGILQTELDNVARISRDEDTNTGKALQVAYTMIKNQRKKHPDHSFAVVLLSDGAVDVGDSQAFREARDKDRSLTAEAEEERSRKLGDDVANGLKNEGIQLHCIALRDPGYSGSATLGPEMQRWSEGITGGMYTILNNSSQIQEAMNNLYKRINKQADMAADIITPNHPARFQVSDGVLQVSVQITPGIDQVNRLDIKRKGRDGNTVQLRNNTDYTVVTSQPQLDTQGNPSGMSDSTIRFISPPAGEYTISIVDTKEYSYDVTIYTIRDLLMELEPVNTVENGFPAEFVLNVKKDGTEFHDDTIDPIAMVSDTSGNIVDQVKLSWNDADKNYHGSYMTTVSGTFSVQVVMTTQFAENISNIQEFNVTRTKIKVRRDALNNIVFSDHAVEWTDQNGERHPGYSSKQIRFDDIQQCYENIENYPVQDFNYSISSGSAVRVEKDADRQVFSIIPVQMGTARLEFTMSYELGRTDAVRCEVAVNDSQAPLLLTSAASQSEGMKSTIEAFLPTDYNEILSGVGSFFEEPNANDGEGFRLECAIEGGKEGGAESRIENDRLEVRGIKAGTYTATITATSYDGSSQSISTRVEIIDRKQRFIFIGAIALAVLVLIAVIIAIISAASKPPFKRSVLNITLDIDGETYEGSSLMLRYGKKAIKLSALCQQNGIFMGSCRSILDKIVVKPRKNGGINVHCGFKGAQTKDIILQSMDGHIIELDQSGGRTVELEYDEEDEY